MLYTITFLVDIGMHVSFTTSMYLTQQITKKGVNEKHEYTKVSFLLCQLFGQNRTLHNLLKPHSYRFILIMFYKQCL